jgi:hypothetical protein
MPAQTYDVTEPIQASIRFAIGQVTVTTDDSGRTSASVEPSEPGDRMAQELADRTRISLDGDELLVEVPGRGVWRGPGSVHIRLTVPSGSSVTVAAGVLTFTSTGRLDEVSIKAGVGTVTVEEATGDVSVRGGSATVDVGSAATVAFKCGRGDLRVDSAQDVYVKTGQGQVDVQASSGKVFVKGAMVSLDVHRASAGEITFEAAMGTARVGAVEGTTVELDLSSATGDARCELAMDGEAPAGAALKVSLRTTSGDVVVTRAAATASASAAG